MHTLFPSAPVLFSFFSPFFFSENIVRDREQKKRDIKGKNIERHEVFRTYCREDTKIVLNS